MYVVLDVLNDSIKINDPKNGIYKVHPYRPDVFANNVIPLIKSSETGSVHVIYKSENGDIHLSMVANEDDECSDNCYFYKSRISCPLCISTNYYKLPKDIEGLTKLEDKLCNSDICIYYDSCESAPLCLLKYILS